MLAKDTFKYHLKLAGRVVHRGITLDLVQRWTAHQPEFPGTVIQQVGRKTTREAALRWEREGGKRSYKKVRPEVEEPITGNGVEMPKSEIEAPVILTQEEYRELTLETAIKQMKWRKKERERSVILVTGWLLAQVDHYPETTEQFIASVMTLVAKIESDDQPASASSSAGEV